MVYVFYNKAHQTLMKRVNSLAKLCHTLHGLGVRFPCNEEQFYMFLKGESSRKATASRLKAFLLNLWFFADMCLVLNPCSRLSAAAGVWGLRRMPRCHVHAKLNLSVYPSCAGSMKFYVTGLNFGIK